MQVGDVVLADKKVYEVTGIYLGGVGSTNLVGLKSVTEWRLCGEPESG